jgi:hypothetical protein
MIKTLDILQGCNSSDPLNPKTINCFAHLLLDLKSLQLVWHFNPLIADPYFDTVELSDAGMSVVMPTNMLNLQTQVVLMRIAASSKSIDVATPDMGKNNPTIDLPVNVDAIRRFFDVDNRYVEYATRADYSMEDLLREMALLVEDPDPVMRQTRAHFLRQFALEMHLGDIFQSKSIPVPDVVQCFR